MPRRKHYGPLYGLPHDRKEAAIRRRRTLLEQVTPRPVKRDMPIHAVGESAPSPIAPPASELVVAAPAIIAPPELHPVARCRWCNGQFRKIDGRHWLCLTEACAERQLAAVLAHATTK